MMDFLKTPKRTTSPRKYGLTSVIDLGVPIGELRHLLVSYGEWIDFAKIGIGTAYVDPKLKEKIELYKTYNIIPYFGGTFFEKCYYQGKLPEYLAKLRQLDINCFEVSCGTLEIALEDRVNLISELKDEFLILSEVGSKDSEQQMSIAEWKQEILYLFEAGSQYVITEGRDSGTSGIYGKDGKVNSNLISELVKDLDVKRIIFEAPTPKHQMFFINEIGANVNLGNIKLNDVLALEAQRLGLRSETFFMEV